MIHLSIDLETYSDVNLKKAGLYRYVQSPAFEILLFAYSFDGAPTQVIDMAQGEKIPLEVIHALTDPQCLKHAYNAAFEWYCLSKYMGAQLPPSQWRDTMLHGLYAGYTAGLDATGRALGIPEDKQKLTTGKALIRYFCVPCKPTKANGGRTRNYPHHDPEKWALFKTYNGQDVVAEMEIERRLSVFPVPDFVQKQWETDLLINARGVAVDMDFCEGALELGETIRAQLTDEAVQLSGLQNPNSVKQLARWLSAETGDDITTLRKETIKELLGRDNADHVQRMLEIRQELGKSTASSTWNSMKTTASSAWNSMKSTASSTWSNIKSSLSSTWNGIKSTASSTWSGIKNAIQNQGWSGVGSNICNGIANGISSGWSWLKNKVSSLASSLLSAAKSALGIHSPSRLFRDEIGLNIGYGVGEGVEASQPSILKSVSGVADAIADEFNASDYKVGNIVPASEVDGALSSFSDRISGSFTSLLDRLQAIADNITFAVPAVAGGVVPYKAAAAAASGGGADIGTTIETSNDALASVVTQVVTNATAAIVTAIQNYSGTTVNFDKTAIAESTIREINRRTRATGKSPLE